MKTKTILMTLSLFLTMNQSFANSNSEVEAYKSTISGHQWKTVGNANWMLDLETGIIFANHGKGFIETDAKFDDFTLKLEFWSATDSNSGVFFRCESEKEINDKNCYEANIFDKRPDQSGRTGGIVNVAAPSTVIGTEGKWNTYEIHVTGYFIQVFLNGVKTVDVQDTTHHKPGRIALQFAAGEIKFRNIELKPRDTYEY